MKIVILCGGFGTRLAGSGNDVPKPMVPIGGKPILWHIMSGFASQGFREFILCLGHRSEVIKQYFLNLPEMIGDVTVDLSGDGATQIHQPLAEMNWKITLAETGHDSMTGHRVKRAAPFIPSDDDIFAVTYGDGVSNLDFRNVVEFHRAHGKMATVTAVRPPTRFGELVLDENGGVREFNEKTRVTTGWINGGFFVFSRRFLDALNNDPNCVLELEPLQQLARDGELMAYQHDDFWFCMDTARDVRLLEEMWSAGHAPWAIWEQDYGK
jgi:glucose-1-phosphate cytidylyltransferase